MTQSKALSLAEHLECNDANMEAQNEAAAELRRLHALNAELVEALKTMSHAFRGPTIWRQIDAMQKAHAALAKAGETT